MEAIEIKTPYDIQRALKRIEEKLIDDMMKNIEEIPTSVDRYKVEQLRRLELYRKRNYQEYTPIFEELNKKMEELIRSKFYEGLDAQEKKMLKAVAAGYTPDTKYGPQGISKSHALNEKKLQALIDATIKDMKKAEHAILRKAEDEYRKIIFDAEVGLNTGTLTPRAAIDMATKDFLAAGIQSIVYKNGARHKISDYADMAIKTANKRAYMYGEGQKRAEHGCHLVIVNKRGDKTCPCCAPYVGQILVDDVYSGGTKAEARNLGYPLLSTAMANGLYHPRCKDIHTTYFPGITKNPPKPLTKKEIEKVRKEAEEKQKGSYMDRQIKKYQRLVKHSLDPNDTAKYRAKVKEWKAKKEEWEAKQK